MSCKTVKKPTSIYNLFMSAQIITLLKYLVTQLQTSTLTVITQGMQETHTEKTFKLIYIFQGVMYVFVQVKKLQLWWFLSSTEIFP